MASTTTRRPLPALIALLALLVLTGLVWWRVLDRSDGSTAADACSTATASGSLTGTPTPSPSATTGRLTRTIRLPAPSAVTLQVLNSTNRAGIAGKARSVLLADGFRVPAIATNDTKYHNKIAYTAQIRYTAANRSAAELVAYYFPGAHLVAERGTSHTVVVSLGKRYKAVSTAAAVRAALAKAHASEPAPTPTPISSSSSSSNC